MDYWVWLSSIRGVGSIRKLRLLNEFKSPEAIYKVSSEELIKINGIDEKTCNIIRNSKNEEYINNISKYMTDNNIKYINIFDDEYPLLLKKIYDAPIVLFYKGNIELISKRCIAVVGAREPTSYGKSMAYNIGKSISQTGRIVVSGLAVGIDEMAHFGALPNTIAVIGSGLDIRYPKENEWLYKKIENNGLILSEYVVGTRPNKYTFPARNRIISGLSEGVIVVQAGIRSGALITAEFAMENGRDVYAVPGNINVLQSEGVNKLIKDGAYLYTMVEDLN